MKTMFNKAKTKSWIKKAHRDQSLAYGHGYVTDGRAMLAEEQHMYPAVLEVFGTLTPECKYPAELFEETIALPDRVTEVIDSQLEYAPDVKDRLRIFYDPKTGQELAINGKYFDLFDNPRAHKYYTNDAMDRLWIVYEDDVVGVIAPIVLQNQLSHIRFKAEGDRE